MFPLDTLLGFKEISTQINALTLSHKSAITIAKITWPYESADSIDINIFTLIFCFEFKLALSCS